MGDVKINYKGSIIAEMSDTGSKTLKTSGTYCEGDITVAYDKPTASDVTSGTKDITSNGEYDVTAFQKANIQVPVPSGYIKPSGTKDITSNGTHDVTSYANAKVSVLPNVKYIPFTVASDASQKWVDINPDGDSDLAAHRADTNMMVMWYRVSDCSQTTYQQACYCSNRPINSYYGTVLIRTSGGASASFINTTLTSDDSYAAKKIIIDSNGVIRTFGSSQYPVRAGDYVCIATW